MSAVNMEMNTIQLDIDKYVSMLKELGVLKTENEELKKRLQTLHNSDYAKCPHFGTLPILNKDSGLEEQLHVCKSGGHFA